ncbi:MAG: substrate-binding domain-containing protein [Kiritimatiellae bacterium]|nr:substrate-binding domain-containing protein [Kiritimatiellia bacterium]
MDTVLFFHTSQREAWRRELAGAYRFARARRWRVQVVEPPMAGRIPEVKRLVAFWKPLGCIAECSGRGGELFSPKLFRGLPAVYLGSDPAALPKSASYVAPPAKGVGEAAAREFLTCGLASFGYVATGGNFFWSLDRERDFAGALRFHGFACQVFGRDGGVGDDARAAALAVWLGKLPKPCGIFAENDNAAAETIDVARRIGFSVPSDISVIGVDNDTELCGNAMPELTSVALDFEWAGYRASEILDALVRKPDAPAMREVYPVIGVARRGSTPAGFGAPPRVLRALEFIRGNALLGINAGDVVSRMPCSRRYAEIEFRKVIGHSILEEILRVRFENVELMLRDRYRTIGAIASLCGWRNENALRAAFRKRYGMSMRDWRRAALAESNR